MSKTTGQYCGVFLRGTNKQIGTLKNWCLNEETLPVLSERSKIKTNKIIGWKATAKIYVFDRPPPPIVEFRFCGKFNYYSCEGAIDKPFVASKEVVRSVLKMGGRGAPRAIWRKKL